MGARAGTGACLGAGAGVSGGGKALATRLTCQGARLGVGGGAQDSARNTPTRPPCRTREVSQAGAGGRANSGAADIQADLSEAQRLDPIHQIDEIA